MIGMTWLLCGVYASIDHVVCRILSHEVTTLIDQGIPTMVGGDFNCIIAPHEKRGGKPYIDDVERKEFRDFIQNNGLVDLGFVGLRFTWCNNHQRGQGSGKGSIGCW